MSGQPPPTRFVRALFPSTAAVHARLGEGLSDAEHAFEAGRVGEALRILLDAHEATMAVLQTFVDESGGVAVPPPARPPKPRRPKQARKGKGRRR